MIAPIWKDVVGLSDADVYTHYIRATGFAKYGETDGNVVPGCCGATPAS